MTDLDALRLYADRRDPDAFSHLVHAYQGLVYTTCRRRLGHDDVDDAVQETFIKLAKQAGSIRSNLAAWLHRAASTTALDHARRANTRRRHERAAATPDAASTDDAWPEVRAALDEAIAALPKHDRALIVEHYLMGRPQADLAKELGVSNSTLSRRMIAAVEKLRDSLTRRGHALPAAALAAGLAAESAAPAAVSAALTAALTKIGLAGVAAGGGLALSAPLVIALVVLAGLVTASVILIRPSAPAPPQTAAATAATPFHDPRLDGEWVLKIEDRQGNPVPDAVDDWAKDLRVIFNGDIVTLRTANGIVGKRDRIERIDGPDGPTFTTTVLEWINNDDLVGHTGEAPWFGNYHFEGDRLYLSMFNSTPPGEFNGNGHRHFLQRARTPAPRTIHVPYHRLRNGEVRYNLVIRPNDVIRFLDPPGFVYVDGGVLRPGAYVLPFDESLTIRQLLASVQVDDAESFRLIRRGGEDDTALAGRIDQLMNGAIEDAVLQADDLIRVDASPIAEADVVARVPAPLRVEARLPFEYTEVRPDDLMTKIAAHRLQVSDLITVTIFELVVPGQESVLTRRIDEQGRFDIPSIPPVLAEGLTPDQLEDRIVQSLEANQVLRDPVVSVTIQEAAPPTYSVIGEPTADGPAIGTYVIPRPDFRLLDAIEQIGGVPDEVFDLLIFRQTEDPDPTAPPAWQGRWVGHEVGNPDVRRVLTVTGSQIDLRSDVGPEWYIADITAVDESADPKTFDAVIRDCPLPAYVGRNTPSIFKLETINGVEQLTYASLGPGAVGRPTGFEPGGGARVFTFERAE